MSKHYQDHEVEFKYDHWEEEDKDMPHMRGVVVYSYGTTAETIINRARQRFNLGDRWKVVRVEMAK